jgi:hypothetical protein
VSRYGWRVWRLGVDEHGPVLVSPYLPNPPTAPGPLVVASCDEGHEAPDPDCVCGLYVMSNRALVEAWCYPAEVVTRVQIKGRRLPGGREVLGALPNEWRVAAVLLTTGYVTPALANKSTALQRRYGIAFTANPGLTVSGPDRLLHRARQLFPSLGKYGG